MKKITYFVLAALLAVSVTACKQQNESSQITIEESSIQSMTESQPDVAEDDEPSNLSEPSEEESSEDVFVPPPITTAADYQYVIVQDKCRLLRYTGTETRVILPAHVTVDGKEYQTEIGPGCFRDTAIKTLSLPEETVEIPERMCENCKQLEDVFFMNVESIREYAFWQCENLKLRMEDLNVGDQTKLKKIGECAFGFSGLYGKVVIRPDMELDDGAFQICKQIEEVEVQSGVTDLPERLFCECFGIKQITLPDTLQTIGDSAFSQTNCSLVTIPKSVTTMGKDSITTERATGAVAGSGQKYTGTMLGYKGSAAESYAKENDIIFSPLD